MRALRYILTFGFFLLISYLTFGSSTFYPYTLKLDNDIMIKSVAYRTYDSPEPGMSWIYKSNKLLYTLSKRLSGYLVTNKTGDILIEINFSLPDLMFGGYLKDENGDSVYFNRFEGEAINIYRTGVLVKSFDFKDLNIDSTMLISNYNQFYWGANNKLIKTPVLIDNDSLSVLCIDNEELIISLADFQINKKKVSNSRLYTFINHREKRKIKVKKHGLPDNFILPLLETKNTIESELADYLGYLSADKEMSSAKLQIYIHTLLIDREGKCVQCYVTPILRNSTSIDFGYEPDGVLKKKIEDWLMCQKYQTKLIPDYSDKYGFSDFIYLK